MGSRRRISASMSARSSRSTPQTFCRAAKSCRATRWRWARRACMAGSSRSRSFSWIARHSARLRAPIPDGSKVWIRPSAASTSAGATWRRAAISARSSVRYPASSRLWIRCSPMLAKPGIGRREIELCLQMLGEARRLGERRLQFRLELAVAGAGRLPGGGRHGLAARRRRARHHPRTCSLRPLLRAQEIGEARNGGVGRGFALLQERIALELGLHIGGKLRMRELQQLDRLHELRSHRQGLALAQLQPLHRTHEPHLGSIQACFLHASVFLPCSLR